jgi:acetoacetate decarboxylase
MTDQQPAEGPQLEQIIAGSLHYNMFGWRYIPKIGACRVDLSQPILYPQGMNIERTRVGKDTVQWVKLSYEQNYSQWEIFHGAC